MEFLSQLEPITTLPHVKRKPLIAVNILKESFADHLYTVLVAVPTLNGNGPENA